MSQPPESRGHRHASDLAGAEAMPVWQPVLLGACAGGMGWGIRGQYGHETGAMIAGLLLSLVLCVLFCGHGHPLRVARAVAWGTIAMGFGGSMTYGQTVGLTHDAALVGNWAALRWGMLGLSIKGAFWIGFAGVFLGMGLGGASYRTRDVVGLMAAALAACALGIWVFNEPYDPANKILPAIYFSADWRWLPAAGAELKPRREVWGGFLLALTTLLILVRWRFRDRLALRLGGWGILGGAIGFPLGQCLQAFHAWNLDYFRSGWWARMDPLMNWWNHMETTFGATMGALLGLGLWLNRALIQVQSEHSQRPLPLATEMGLILLHLVLLVGVEFSSIRWIDSIYDFGLVLGLLPIIGVANGRWWPFLVMMPITAIPIAGKTFRNLVNQSSVVSAPVGGLLYLAIPLALTGAICFWSSEQSDRGTPARQFLVPALLVSTWLYFGLNYAFFRFPWPWEAWTARTPNALVFLVCAIGLTVEALKGARFKIRDSDLEGASSNRW